MSELPPTPEALPAPPAAPVASPPSAPAPRHALAGLPQLLILVGVALLVILAGVLLARPRLTPDEARLTAARIEQLRTGDPGERVAAAYMLGATNDARALETAVPALIEALADADAEVRTAAWQNLRQLAVRRFQRGDFPWYNPDGPAEARAAGLARWRDWWLSAAAALRREGRGRE